MDELDVQLDTMIDIVESMVEMGAYGAIPVHASFLRDVKATFKDNREKVGDLEGEIITLKKGLEGYAKREREAHHE